MPVNLTANKTPQTERARRSQTKNSAGGYAWPLDQWARLDRFLILGTEGGTLYATQGEVTRENTRNLQDCVASDAKRVLNRVIEVSHGGMAYKNDYALFAMAVLITEADPETRRATANGLPRVARTASHLFTFINYATSMRGWGRILREAVANWYNEQHSDALEYQMVKYRNRAGWTHRDALRVAHPQPATEYHERLFNWATQGGDGDVNGLINAMRTAQEGNALAALSDEPSLPREALPTEALNDARVWEVMIKNGMPMTALIRNLATLTRVGALKPLSDVEEAIVQQLRDGEALRKSRIHPIQVLAALVTYSQGHGTLGRGEWTSNGRVVDALDEAFYRTFRNVHPTGKRIMIALDVSGSMGWAHVGGVPGLTARMGSAALALVTANVEERHMIVGFQDEITRLGITAKDSLKGAVDKVSGLPFGRTDCAQPMLTALQHDLDVDAFVVLTDSETWAGSMHPFEALREYRRRKVGNAKLAVIGMASNGFSIADPDDAGMMDFVGFNPGTPQALGQFLSQD